MKPAGKKENNKKDRGERSKTGNEHKHEKIKFVLGIFLTTVALYILVAFIAYIFWWKSDASLARNQMLSGPEIQVKNWSGKLGVIISQFFITNGFGIGALFIPLIIALPGLKLLNFPGIKPWRLTIKFAATTIIVSLIFGYIFNDAGGFLGSGPGGAQGYFAAQWLNAFMGKPGTGILLLFLTLAYLVLILNISPHAFVKLFPPLKSKSEKTAPSSPPAD